MFELIYTSVPQGLLPGTRGFSTAAFTAGMPPNLIMPLENLSGYNFTFQDGTLPDELNPPCCRYIKMRFGNQLLRIASRIAPNGLDYSKRNNKIAHHWIFESADEIAQSGSGAAGLLQSSGCFAADFTGPPRELAFRKVPAVAPAKLPARTFQKLAGNSGWANWIVEQYRTTPEQPVYIKYPRHTDTTLLLELVREICALLSEDEISDFTFSTYFAAAGNSVECFLRMLPDFSPLLTNIERFHANKLLNLDGRQILPEEYNDLPLSTIACAEKTPERQMIVLPDDPEEKSDHYQLPLPPDIIPEAPHVRRTTASNRKKAHKSADNCAGTADHKKLRTAALITVAAIMVISVIILLYPQKKSAKEPDIKIDVSRRTEIPSPAPSTAPAAKRVTKVQTLPAAKVEKPAKQSALAPSPSTELSLFDAAVRARALPVDDHTGLKFFTEFNKAVNCSANDFTMPLPEKLQFPDEIFAELRIPGQDKILPDSSNFIRKSQPGGIVIIDAEPGKLPYKPRTADAAGPKLHIVPTPDGKALRISRTGNFHRSTLPVLSNIDKIYFRYKNNVRYADRKFRKEYQQYIPQGKLSLGFDGNFSYTNNLKESYLHQTVEPRIGNTSMMTFCSRHLPIPQWNQTVPLYFGSLEKLKKMEKILGNSAQSGIKPYSKADLETFADDLKKSPRYKDMERMIQQITEILNSFLSADLLHRNSAADNDIKNLLKRAEDKLDEFSEDHHTRRKQADAALKTWYKICSQITQRRVQLARYQQYRRELKKHTQDIKSLYNRMVNTVKPAGTDAENKLNSLLVDSSGRRRTFCGIAEENNCNSHTG